MKQDIVVVGAGGHAKVCIEILRSMGESVGFCVGDDSASTECMGVPVLKGDHNLPVLYDAGYRRIFIGLGSNRLRERLATVAVEHGYSLVNAIHPQAVISPSVTLGRGVAIMAGVVINASSVISTLAIINTGATIDHDCVIGKAVHVAPQSALAGNVKIGDFSFLGVGTKVIPEVTIGVRVTVGAGSVVIKDIEDNQTVVGVPARPKV